MVANKIYTKTHEGLTDLVSARVASQVLDNGLRARRYSAETVTVRQMASVLKGPVMKELSGNFPRAGLERNLKKLLKTLKTMPAEKVKPDDAEPEPDLELEEAGVAEVTDAVALNEAALNEAVSDETVSDEAVSDEAVSDKAVSDIAASDDVTGADETQTDEAAQAEVVQTEAAETSAEPDVEEAQGEAATKTEPVSTLEHAERSGVGSSSSAPQVTQVLERTVVAPPVARAPLEPAARDRMMLGFAELEHVKMVAAFENGAVSSVLGQGFEVAALSRLGTLGLTLLGRSGELRTFYVAHAQGQLFLFPLGATTLMLIGSSELNLGLVFATLQKLKEEL